jgi:hypothetical protein
MSKATNTGYLILGDITGYTSYVASTELEHSQEILTELLELIITHFKKLLTIVKIEGEARFAYVPSSRLSHGERVFELLETTYIAFRKRVQSIKYSTTCQCKACQAIPKLDLKFFTHYGQYAIQNILGITELVGSDVNLVHRLTKNHVTEKTGWDAYALFTVISLSQLGLNNEGMYKLTENYDHLGDIEACILDLQTHYSDHLKKKPVIITSEEADKNLSFEFDVPPINVWDWLTDPEKRTKVDPDNVWSAVTRKKGRNGIGAKNHCVHGNNEVTGETILDWQPFEYYSLESIVNLKEPTPFDAIITYQFLPIDNGAKTQVNLHFKFLNKSEPEFLDPAFQRFAGVLTTFNTNMNRLILENK